MAEQKIDRLLGLVLMLISVLWFLAVEYTIQMPMMVEPGPNSKTFPTLFGVTLGFLGLLVIALSFRQCAPPSLETDPDPKPVASEGRTHCSCVAWILMLLIVYTFTLQLMGFIPSTLLMVLASLLLMLRVFKPVLVLGMSVGIPVVVYMVFNQLLGVYLPRGEWLQLPWL
jgi:hypothetical protein